MAQLVMHAGITQKFIDGECKLVFCPWNKSIVLIELRFVFFYNSDAKIVFDSVTMRTDDESGFELLRGGVKDNAIALLKSCPDWEREVYAADQAEKKRIIAEMSY